MADLIDRDAVEDIITNALNGYLTDDVRNTLEGIGIAISDIPSADIDLSDFSDKLWAAAYERGKAEVVRCKNCKYFDSGTDEDGKLFFKCLGWVYGGTSEDDFCSHGERKDG